MPVLMRRLHLHMLSWGHPSSCAGPQPQPRSNSAKHRAVAHIQLLGLPGVDVVVVAAQLDQEVGREGGEARALGGLRRRWTGMGKETHGSIAWQGRWGHITHGAANGKQSTASGVGGQTAVCCCSPPHSCRPQQTRSHARATLHMPRTQQTSVPCLLQLTATFLPAAAEW